MTAKRSYRPRRGWKSIPDHRTIARAYNAYMETDAGEYDRMQDMLMGHLFDGDGNLANMIHTHLHVESIKGRDNRYKIIRKCIEIAEDARAVVDEYALRRFRERFKERIKGEGE